MSRSANVCPRNRVRYTGCTTQPSRSFGTMSGLSMRVERRLRNGERSSRADDFLPARCSVSRLAAADVLRNARGSTAVRRETYTRRPLTRARTTVRAERGRDTRPLRAESGDSDALEDDRRRYVRCRAAGRPQPTRLERRLRRCRARAVVRAVPDSGCAGAAACRPAPSTWATRKRCLWPARRAIRTIRAILGGRVSTRT